MNTQSQDYSLPRFTGTICRVAAQCKDPQTGKIGDWLYSGAEFKTSHRVSPLFNDLADLFTWARANGFEGVGVDYAFRGAQI